MSKVAYSIAFLRKNILQVLSLIILILAFIMTWMFFQSKHKFPESTHLEIQQEFQKIIVERLLKKNPLIENVQFQELWTETTDRSQQIKAVFSYTFVDPSQTEPDDQPIKVTVTGSALINRESASEEVEQWKVGPFDVDQTELDFENEVIVIVPEKESNKNQEPSPTSKNLKTSTHLYI